MCGNQRRRRTDGRNEEEKTNVPGLVATSLSVESHGGLSVCLSLGALLCVRLVPSILTDREIGKGKGQPPARASLRLGLVAVSLPDRIRMVDPAPKLPIPSLRQSYLVSSFDNSSRDYLREPDVTRESGTFIA